MSMMPQPLVQNRIGGNATGVSGSGHVAAPLSRAAAFRPEEGRPMRRLGKASGDFYRLTDKVVKIEEKALVFGQSVTEKPPQQ